MNNFAFQQQIRYIAHNVKSTSRFITGITRDDEKGLNGFITDYFNIPHLFDSDYPFDPTLESIEHTVDKQVLLRHYKDDFQFMPVYGNHIKLSLDVHLCSLLHKPSSQSTDVNLSMFLLDEYLGLLEYLSTVQTLQKHINVFIHRKFGHQSSTAQEMIDSVNYGELRRVLPSVHIIVSYQSLHDSLYSTITTYSNIPWVEMTKESTRTKKMLQGVQYIKYLSILNDASSLSVCKTSKKHEQSVVPTDKSQLLIQKYSIYLLHTSTNRTTTIKSQSILRWVKSIQNTNSCVCKNNGQQLTCWLMFILTNATVFVEPDTLRHDSLAFMHCLRNVFGLHINDKTQSVVYPHMKRSRRSNRSNR
jgi:hypothetical protein